ncbi:MAG: hypothetical protein ACIAXF_15120 [Phycisphaerales bacterium JB063]
MSEPTNAAQAQHPSGPLAKHHFLLRRLHSLSGILPVGVFLCMHLFTNAQMIWGQEEGPDAASHFQHEVDFIHAMPALLFIEITLWLSIGFHAALGFWYTFTGKSNVKSYKYGGNWRYLFQRITGMVALLFIFLHIATLRWRWDLFGWFSPFYGHGGVNADGEVFGHNVPMALPYTAYALQVSWLVVAFYAVGVLSAVYHWSNGLWTAAISWGITTSEAAMKRWGVACLGLFVVLMAFSVTGIVAALVYDLEEDTTPEQKAVLATVIEDTERADELWGSIPSERRDALREWIKHEINEYND